MAKLIAVAKRLLAGRRQPSALPRKRRRRDPQFVGRSSIKEIEQAPPERVGELVGHAPERVNT
ncbi:MAG TPA: hypothetical protein VGF70_02205 [Solirubrobacteraceae bacterium]|jgi:hypothetical protein